MMNQHKVTTGNASRPKLSQDGRTMMVSIPFSLHRKGGRKKVVTPSDAPAWSPRSSRIDNTIVKALVRAHRWRNMLETGLFTTVRELAKAERINESYLCRVLRLTLLSPTIAEAILNGRQPEDLSLARLLQSLPIEWERQTAAFQIQAGLG
jgi:hypothetical protein